METYLHLHLEAKYRGLENLLNLGKRLHLKQFSMVASSTESDSEWFV